MDKVVHSFPKGISPKVNVIAQLGFELTYYDLAVQPLHNLDSSSYSVLVVLFSSKFYLIYIIIN